MELPPLSTTVTTTATAATTVKTPDLETEPQQSNTITKQLISPPLTNTNGILKHLKPLHHHNHHHQPPPTTTFTYKECLKNHAAAMGSHATDGCGEFILDDRLVGPNPTSLKCAACGCHRNFHRREPADSPPIQHLNEYQPHHRHHPPQQQTSGSPLNSPSPPPISSSYYPSSAPHMLLALSSPDTNNHRHTPMTGKKRFRTKFTRVQKEKMHQVAEKVGWKMQKKDEELINGICNEIGVDRNVFKVWMHNNKSNNNKKDGIDFIISKNHINHEEKNIGVDLPVDQGVTRHVDHHLHLNGGSSNVNVSCFSNVVVGGNVIKGSSSSC